MMCIYAADVPCWVGRNVPHIYGILSTDACNAVHRTVNNSTAIPVGWRRQDTFHYLKQKKYFQTVTHTPVSSNWHDSARLNGVINLVVFIFWPIYHDLQLCPAALGAVIKAKVCCCDKENNLAKFIHQTLPKSTLQKYFIATAWRPVLHSEPNVIDLSTDSEGWCYFPSVRTEIMCNTEIYS